MAGKAQATRRRRAAVQEEAAPRRATLASPEVVPGGLPEFDRLIHERLRLGIVSALAGARSLSFIELRTLLKTTDGNLSVHARKLEEAGYVQCEKGFEGRVPRSDYRLTGAGRRALNRYLEHMEALIRTMREGGSGR